MSQTQESTVYLDIIRTAQDPVALRLGIVCSEVFAEEIKEKARHSDTLEDLQALVEEQRRLVAAD